MSANVNSASMLSPSGPVFGSSSAQAAQAPQADSTTDELLKLLQALEQEEARLEAGQGGQGEGCEAPGAQGAQQFPQVGSGTPSLPGMGAASPACQQQDPDAMTGEQADAVSVLSRHEDAFDKHGTKFSDLEKKANDPKSDMSPDLREAIKTVSANPDLKEKLDGNGDGKISSKDINRMAQEPEVRSASQQKAQSYVKNYIPSSDTSGTTQGRPMTKEDAMRELSDYSDSLPKDLDPQTLAKIADGSQAMGKRPPQVQAAAQYFVEHPDQWKEMNNGKDSVSKSEFQTNVADKGQLTQDETDALQRLKSDPTGAFKGNITLDSLKKIAEDPKADPEDKKTAQALLGKNGTGSNLFYKLDDANKGYKAKGLYEVDDKKISQNDIKALDAKESANGVYKAPAASTAPQGRAGAAATQDMLDGETEQAGKKSTKKTGLAKFVDGLKSIAHGFLEAGRWIAKVGSMVLGAIAKLPIPGLEQIAALGAAGLATGSKLFQAADDGMRGGTWKKDLVQAPFEGVKQLTSLVPGGFVANEGVNVAEGAAGAAVEGQDVGQGAVTGASRGLL